MPVEPSPDTLPDVARTAEQQATAPSTSSSRTAARCGCGLRSPPTRTPLLAFFAGLSERSLYLRFHGDPARRPRRSSEPLPRPGLGRARRARRHARRRAAASASSRSRATCACATRRPPRSPSPSPTTMQGRGIGTRLLEQLAARAAERGIDALRRRGDGREPRDARRLRDAGFDVARELEQRRGRGPLPDRAHRGLPRARRRARPRRRRRLAAAVLRARDASP